MRLASFSSSCKTMRFVVALMLVVGAASEGPADCSWHFADTGNTYNLAPIKKSAA